MVSTYINPGEALFPPQTWNHFEEAVAQVRTINHLESFHCQINDRVNAAHPNLYRFLTVLREQQYSTHITFLQLQAGQTVSAPKKRKYAQNERKISNLKQAFLNGEIDIIMYSSGISFALGHV